MTAKVVDSSALAALSFQEAAAAEITRRLDGHELHAPALLRFEMANVCIKKIRAQPAERELLLRQHRDSLGVPIHRHEIEPQEVLALAEKFNLSAYDASYLWLARSMGAELVTLDERLRKAAAKA